MVDEERPEHLQKNPEPSPERPAGPGHRSPVHPDLEWREVRPGRRPGSSYIRIMRPHIRYFRRVAPGVLEATPRVSKPKGGLWGNLSRVKRFLIGNPLATAELAHERLTKIKALAVLSSDALSSSAYAPEEILRTLILAGTAALSLSLPIAVAITILLIIVATSYRQTIRAYPQGGGSYIVTKDNLGMLPALTAGASLLVGYVLTVAVSIAAGVAAITSAFPSLHPERVIIGVVFVALITVINLRGVRESASIFAAPTYIFIGSMAIMLVLGLVHVATGTPVNLAPSEPAPIVEALTIFLVLRAFASGCAALTGTEAISDGVPAFKPPEYKNARATLSWMAGILAVLFVGLTFLANRFGAMPNETETVISQVSRGVFGTSPFYYLIQAATALILVLAANTSFSDFPRLAYFMARDGFLPHQFSLRGDRLAFSNGIIALGLVAALLLVIFGGDTHALIPLYAVGVFIAFTISQSSMVYRWWKRQEPGWRRGLAINGVGAVTTGVVAVVLAVTKFVEGAWIVVVLIPVLVFLLRAIHQHYDRVARHLQVGESAQVPPPVEQVVLVPVAGLDRAVLQTLAYARSISPNTTAVHVTDDHEEGERLQLHWEKEVRDIPLVILESPYRSLLEPLLAYVDAIDQQDPGIPVTVVLSEFVPAHWWEHLLHGQTALRLKAALLFRPHSVVISVPYHDVSRLE